MALQNAMNQSCMGLTGNNCQGGVALTSYFLSSLNFHVPSQMIQVLLLQASSSKSILLFIHSGLLYGLLVLTGQPSHTSCGLFSSPYRAELRLIIVGSLA